MLRRATSRAVPARAALRQQKNVRAGQHDVLRIVAHPPTPLLRRGHVQRSAPSLGAPLRGAGTAPPSWRPSQGSCHRGRPPLAPLSGELSRALARLRGSRKTLSPAARVLPLRGEARECRPHRIQKKNDFSVVLEKFYFISAKALLGSPHKGQTQSSGSSSKGIFPSYS